MKKTIVTTVLAAFLLTLGLPMAYPSTTYAQSSNNSNPIWEGLWSGVNLNIGHSSRRSNKSSPTSSTTPSHIYAALGDSVAAGQGLNGGSLDSQCGRSPQAYATKVAKEKKLQLIHAACSGATVGDLFTQQHISGPNPQPQLDTAFAKGTPELITITAGANDVSWFNYLKLRCYQSTCGSDIDNGVLNALRSTMHAKYLIALADIQNRSNGHPPTVVITGYYNPLSTRCSSIQSQITPSELAWINAQVRALNNTLQDISNDFSFTKFVAVNFSGHDLCSSSPWVQGINDPAPLHPTGRGQEAIAQSVLRVL